MLKSANNQLWPPNQTPFLTVLWIKEIQSMHLREMTHKSLLISEWFLEIVTYKN